MKFRHGIDLVELSRIQKAMQNFPDRFIKKILTSCEQKQFFARGCRIEYLAGRFAAKEAVLKALGLNFQTSGPCFDAIEVLNEAAGGAPTLKFYSPLIEAWGDATNHASLSITHTAQYALASVVMWSSI